MKNEQKLREYPYEFRYNGKLCGSSILATSIEEAEEILDAIGRSGKIIGGPIEGTVPAYPGSETYVRFYVWWRNLKRKLFEA